MTTKRANMDPLGRSHELRPAALIAICVALAISGSAWPIQARSERPILDSSGPGASSRPA